MARLIVKINEKNQDDHSQPSLIQKSHQHWHVVQMLWSHCLCVERQCRRGKVGGKLVKKFAKFSIMGD